MESKTCIVFVPHEDDELNVAGPIIPFLNKKYDTIFVFMTNGGSGNKAEARVKEAISSLKYLHTRRKNIIFLGYPDRFYENDTHLWINSGQYSEENGKAYTESTLNGETWHFYQHGEQANLTRNALIDDLCEIIELNMPDLIIGVDYDYHCDHRVLSMALDEAIGITLNRHREYEPLVYKTYAYATMYTGKNDFCVTNLPICTYESEDICNPFLRWEDRIRYPVEHSKLLMFNNLALAYAKHVSQLATSSIARTINSDHVFWIRRTDNLLKNHCISSECGIERLWDFRLFSTEDIMRKCPIDQASWEKNSFYLLRRHSKFALKLDGKYTIESVRIFGRQFGENVIPVDMGVSICEMYSRFKIGEKIIDQKISDIDLITDEIIIDNFSENDVALTEVEVFEKKPYEIEEIFIETCNSADRRIYYSQNEISYKIVAREKKGRVYRIEGDDIEWEIHAVGIKKPKIKEDVLSIPKSCNRFTLIVKLKTKPEIYGKTVFKRYTVFTKMKVFLIKSINYIYHNVIGEWSKRKRQRMITKWEV